MITDKLSQDDPSTPSDSQEEVGEKPPLVSSKAAKMLGLTPPAAQLPASKTKTKPGHNSTRRSKPTQFRPARVDLEAGRTPSDAAASASRKPRAHFAPRDREEEEEEKEREREELLALGPTGKILRKILSRRRNIIICLVFLFAVVVAIAVVSGLKGNGSGSGAAQSTKFSQQHSQVSISTMTMTITATKTITATPTTTATTTTTTTPSPSSPSLPPPLPIFATASITPPHLQIRNTAAHPSKDTSLGTPQAPGVDGGRLPSSSSSLAGRIAVAHI